MSSSSAYRVTQLGAPDGRNVQRNIGVSDLDSLVTHHPRSNLNARMIDGVADSAENSTARSYAVVGGEFQEVQVIRTDRKYQSLQPHQVLLIKDFILDDPDSADSRRVDVPAPCSGVVGRVDVRNGVVDVLDPATNRLIVRVRHLGPIAVAVGDSVAYGQALGTQNNIGLPASAGRHVHIEMDTREYQQLDHYIGDLVDGRLPVQAAYRAGVQPRPVVDDGVQRVGEAGERVAAVQRALVALGYRDAAGGAIEADGVYRLSMQGAVLAFQHDHGLPPSGDIDSATWGAALDATLGKPILPPRAFDEPTPAALPRGHQRMLEQIRGHVAALDAGHGRHVDAASERMSHALLRLASERQLESVDHVVLGAPARGQAATGTLFIVQGALQDPAHRRASIDTGEAASTPVAESLAHLRSLDPPLATAAHAQHAQVPSAPAMHRDL